MTELIPDFYSASSNLLQQLKRRVTVLRRAGTVKILVQGPKSARLDRFLSAFAGHYAQETLIVPPESGVVGGNSQVWRLMDALDLQDMLSGITNTQDMVRLASMKYALFNTLTEAMQQRGIRILIVPDAQYADVLLQQFIAFLTASWRFADVMGPGSVAGPVVLVTNDKAEDGVGKVRIPAPTEREVSDFLRPLVDIESLARADVALDLDLVERLRSSMNNALWQTPERVAMAQSLAEAGRLMKQPFGTRFAAMLLGVSTKEALSVIETGMATGILTSESVGWSPAEQAPVRPETKDHIVPILEQLIGQTGSPAAWLALWQCDRDRAAQSSTKFLNTALARGYGAEAMELLRQKAVTPDPDARRHALVFTDASVDPGDDPYIAFRLMVLRGDMEGAETLASQVRTPLLSAWMQYEKRDLKGCMDTLKTLEHDPEVHILRANCLMRMGDMEGAENEALRVQTGDRILNARLETLLGIIALRQGLFTRAVGKFQKALVEAESMGLTFASALLRDNLAITYEYMGRYAAAFSQLKDAIVRYSRCGYTSGVVSGLVFLADLYTFFGEPMTALKVLDTADALIAKHGLERESVHAMAKRGEAMAEAGHIRAGSELLFEAARKFEDMGLRVEAAQAVSRATLYRAAGEMEVQDPGLDQGLDPEAWAIGQLAMGIQQAGLGRRVYAEDLMSQAAEVLRHRGSRYFHAWAAIEITGLLEDGDTAAQYLDQAAETIREIAAQVPREFQDAFRNRSLARRIADAGTQKAKQGRRVRGNPEAVSLFEGMVGSSQAFVRAIGIARRVASTNLPVLITGESGTGKELMARMIHRLSDRKEGPFITINAAAVPEGILAGELFGYEKGAFTGAERRRIGKFEAASHGTLFLDEIGDISANLQKHLLRVLESGQVQRLGSNETITVDTRVIFATNKDLEVLVRQGAFRLDLFHRIAGLNVDLPPLRKRRDDIPQLVEYLSGQLESEVGRRIRLSKDAMDVLKSYAFPGNIRELRNMLQALAIHCDDEVIDRKSLLRTFPRLDRTKPAADAVQGDVLVSRVLRGEISLAEARRALEYTAVRLAMEQTNGNISQAARLLNMKRPRLSQMVKDFGLKGGTVEKEVLR